MRSDRPERVVPAGYGDPVAAVNMLSDASEVGFDPGDPGFLADPYPVLARLREAAPAWAYPDRGVILLTRFDDVHAALRDRRLGRAYDHRYTDAEFGRPGPDPRFPQWNASERFSLLNLEPPDHTRLRRLVSKVFTAASVANLRPEIERLAQQQLSGLPLKFDLIGQFAQPFSIAVICTLLGVPVSDGQLLLDWSHAIVKMYEFRVDAEEQDRAERAAGAFIEYVTELIDARRRDPRSDLISELVAVSDAGDRLTVDEIVGTVIVLLNAGHEATVNTLGNGMRALQLHPEQWQRAVTGEVPAGVAVEEMIRWDPPLQLFERWVLDDDVEIAGNTLGPGDRIAMLFGSANRDGRRFPDPDRFDVGRGDSTHIGFGGGLHFCIGAPLARLELTVALDLLRALPHLELVEIPTYQPYFVLRGLSALHLSTGGTIT